MKKNSESPVCRVVKRRDFLCQSAVLCGAAGLPLAAASPHPRNKKPGLTQDPRPEELIAYCGLYCGACDIYQQRISTAGNDLKQVLDGLDFKTIAQQMPGLEDYDSFYKVLNTLIMYFGQCQGCARGGGNPQCPAKICCREKGYRTCAECSQAPCEKIAAAGVAETAAPNLKEIQSLGREKWAREQQAKVEKGFRYSQALQTQKK